MNQIPNDILNQYKEYGFDEILILQAWSQCGGNQAHLMDTIYSVQQENEKALKQIQHGQGGNNKKTNDELMEEEQQAIIASLQDEKSKDLNFEPLNPEQRIRNDGIPVGLKNVGNTCYFNSMLQTYFLNFKFVREILSFQKANDQEDDSQDPIQKKRKEAGIKLVQNLQKLFALLIGSDKKYIDPTDVLKQIVDEQGEMLPIGDQKDIGEFNICFLSTLDEGLKQSQQYKEQHKYDNQNKMQEEKLNDSQLTYQGTQSMESPLKALVRSHSTAITEEDSIINNLFFGKSQVKISYPLGDETKTNIKDELFNIIFLDIKHKNIYQAWDESIINEIEGYKNDKGDYVTAQKENWILKQPPTLFFQLKRVFYCQESKMVKKTNEPFHFEQEIFLDRFMLHNNEKYLKIRQRVKKYQEEYNKIEDVMKKIQNFGIKSSENQQSQIEEGSQHLLTSLQTTVDFLQIQQNSQNPHQADPLFFSNSQKVGEALQLIQQYQNSVQQRIQDFKNQLQNIEDQISASYNDLKHNKYRLQSILIHEGLGADQGHYYSFIQDFQDGKWRRYNDQTITEVSIDEVMKDSIGGGSRNSSASCLIYISDEQIQREIEAGKNIPLRAYKTSNAQEQDLYKKILPLQMKQFLEQDNSNFRIQVQEYKDTQVVKKIIDNYIQKFELINQLKRKQEELKSKHKNSPPDMINYVVYLKGKTEKKNIDNIIKYQILDTCVREHHEKKYCLQDLDQNSNFTKKLKQASINLGQYKAPPLEIPDDDYDYLNRELANYLLNLTNSEASMYFMNSIVKDEIHLGLSSLDYLLDINRDKENSYYFKKLANDSKNVIIMQSMYTIDKQLRQQQQQNITDKQWEQITDVLKIIVAFHYKYMREFGKMTQTLKIWYTDLAAKSGNEDRKQQVFQIQQWFDKQQENEEYKKLLEQNVEELNAQVEKTNNDGDPYNWNMNKVEDVHLTGVLSTFDNFKQKVMKALQLSKVILQSDQIVTSIQRDKELYE